MPGRTTALWTIKAAIAGLVVGVTLGVATSVTLAQGVGGCPACPTTNMCEGCGNTTEVNHCCRQPRGSDENICMVDGC